MKIRIDPLISVLMPVRNGITFLDAAISSILNQSFCDFELIVVDDGSTDGTKEALEKYSRDDSRIRVINNFGPFGVGNALNLGLRFCRGQYIARQDADDISYPHRLEMQVQYLEDHPDIAIVGSSIELMNVEGILQGLHAEPVTPAAVFVQTFFGTPFAHPSVMIRIEFLNHVAEPYREVPAQDYDLWVRMINAGLRGGNIAEPLVVYRVFSDSDSHVRANKHAQMADLIAQTQIRIHSGIDADTPLLGSARCKQIAYALICGTSFDFLAEDKVYGDAIVDLVRQIHDLPAITHDEINEFYEELSRRWHSIRSRLMVAQLLSNRSGLLTRGIQIFLRYCQSFTYIANSEAKRHFIAQVPIIINTRDRVSELRVLVDWLRKAGHKRIIILDNASTYQPLCSYLDEFDGRVIRLNNNLGHTALWQVSELADLIRKEWFVYTDPDVVPTDQTPLDAVAYFRELLLKFPQYEKVGFALKIDDLPWHFKLRNQVIAWEKKQYKHEVAPNVFSADIDTTFALYRPGSTYSYGPALRTTGEYQARHMPWYSDSENPTEEDIYYRQHALQNVTTWSGDLSAPMCKVNCGA